MIDIRDSIKNSRRANTLYQRFVARVLEPADTVIVHYPKSGSTWVRFLLHAVVTGERADFDTIRRTIAPLQLAKQAPKLLDRGGRLLHTHYPLGSAPGRMIYLVRDGRNVAVSYHRHLSGRGLTTDSAPEFVAKFAAQGVDGNGPWAQHVERGLHAVATTPERALLVRYEDLLLDAEQELGRMVAFLGLERSIDEVRHAVALSDRKQMAAQEASAGIRSESVPEFVGLHSDRSNHRDALSGHDVEVLNASLRGALTALGYPTGSVDDA